MWVETKFRSGSVRSLVLCFSPRRGCVTAVSRNPTITPGWKVFMDGKSCTTSVAGRCYCPWAGLGDLNPFAKVFWNISCNSIERSSVSAVVCGPALLYCSASLWGPAVHSDSLMNKLRFVQILLDIPFCLLICQAEALRESTVTINVLYSTVLVELASASWKLWCGHWRKRVGFQFPQGTSEYIWCELFLVHPFEILQGCPAR